LQPLPGLKSDGSPSEYSPSWRKGSVVSSSWPPEHFSMPDSQFPRPFPAIYAGPLLDLEYRPNEFPRNEVREEAEWIADNLAGPAADEQLSLLFFHTNCHFLGLSDRREMVEEVLEKRKARLAEFLQRLGLRKESAEPDDYSRGSWFLTACDEDDDVVFLCGVGEIRPIRLHSSQLSDPTSVWQAISAATTSLKGAKPQPCQWQRMWCGFEYRGPDGKPRHAQGIFNDLWGTFFNYSGIRMGGRR